jgi:hypothetical protein
MEPIHCDFSVGKPADVLGTSHKTPWMKNEAPGDQRMIGESSKIAKPILRAA